MMTDYPYENFLINARALSIRSVIAGEVLAQTPFEQHTFDFIRQWFSGEDILFVQTSGSTGAPKQIALRRSQMVASAKLTGKALGLASGMNAVVALDTKHIAGKMMLVRSFVLGLKIIAIEPGRNPFDTLDEHTSIDFIALVPYQIQHILESKHPQILNRISTCIIGGAPLNKHLEKNLRAYTVKAFVTYGMTETVSHIALKQVAPVSADFFTCLPGIAVSTDHRNCLVIDAPYLDERVTTNDVVSLHNNQQFEWQGRYDNIINSAGLKISPELLEAEIVHLFTRRSINQPFFFHGVPDEKLGYRLVMVFASPAPAVVLMNDIKKTLKHTFSPYHIPKEFYEAADFIYTPTQKINRQKTFESARLIS